MQDYTEWDTYVFTVHGALTHERCDELIAYSENEGYEEATITTAAGFVMAKDVRNNDRVIVDNDEFVDELFPLVRDYIPDQFDECELLSLNERFRFYRYGPGQQFNWHYDGYYQRDNGEISHFTLMFYLNDDFEGGSTDFEEFSVKPEKGSALVFWHPIRHRGSPVVSGTKYVLRTDVMFRPII